MAEDIKVAEDWAKKNTVGKVGMIFSIIGLVLVITIIWLWLWFWCLIIWLILWIIGLFFKPKGKAIAAVIISIITLWLMALGCFYLYKQVKTPATEFVTWLETISEDPQYAALFDENNSDKLENLIEAKCWNIPDNFVSEDFDTILENAKWDNMIQKFSFIIFDSAKTCMQDALDSYTDNSESNITEEENETAEPTEEVVVDEENEIEELIESIDNEVTETLDNVEEEAHIEEVLDILSAE